MRMERERRRKRGKKKEWQEGGNEEGKEVSRMSLEVSRMLTLDLTKETKFLRASLVTQVLLL